MTLLHARMKNAILRGGQPAAEPTHLYFLDDFKHPDSEPGRSATPIRTVAEDMVDGGHVSFDSTTPVSDQIDAYFERMGASDGVHLSDPLTDDERRVLRAACHRVYTERVMPELPDELRPVDLSIDPATMSDDELYAATILENVYNSTLQQLREFGCATTRAALVDTLTDDNKIRAASRAAFTISIMGPFMPSVASGAVTATSALAQIMRTCRGVIDDTQSVLYLGPPTELSMIKRGVCANLVGVIGNSTYGERYV